MASILENLFANNTGADINQSIALNAIAGSASACTAYLGAALQATTPEVRRLFSEYLNQGLTAHEILTGLAVKREWIKPYNSPEDQLKISYQIADSVVQNVQVQ